MQTLHTRSINAWLMDIGRPSWLQSINHTRSYRDHFPARYIQAQSAHHSSPISDWPVLCICMCKQCYYHTQYYCNDPSLTWLHVSVEIAMLVDVSQALQDLMTPAPDAGLWHQLGPVLGQLIQIAILQVPPFQSWVAGLVLCSEKLDAPMLLTLYAVCWAAHSDSCAHVCMQQGSSRRHMDNRATAACDWQVLSKFAQADGCSSAHGEGQRLTKYSKTKNSSSFSRMTSLSLTTLG